MKTLSPLYCGSTPQICFYLNRNFLSPFQYLAHRRSRLYAYTIHIYKHLGFPFVFHFWVLPQHLTLVIHLHRNTSAYLYTIFFLRGTFSATKINVFYSNKLLNVVRCSVIYIPAYKVSGLTK